MDKYEWLSDEEVVIEDMKIDPRETMLILSLLDHSARKIGTDRRRLFETAAVLARLDTAALLREFTDRPQSLRSIQSIIEEIRILQCRYNVSYISFIDELLMSSPRRTIDLCESFIKAGLKIRWCCFGRLNYAIPEVIKAMKKAGCGS